MSNLTTVQPTVSQAINLPDWIRALYTIYLILILVIGLPGNVVIAVVYGRTAPKTACDWLIFTMGVTDAFVCLFSPMLHLRSEFEIEIPWLTGVWCGLDHWLQYTAMIASLIILVVVAVDRYIKICKPALHSLTPVMARHVCGWSIPVSAALCVFPTMDSFKDDLCVHARPRVLSQPTRIYYTCVFCVFVLSFVLVTFAYFSVCRRIGEKVRLKQRLLENDGLGPKASAPAEARDDEDCSSWWKAGLSCCESSPDRSKKSHQADHQLSKNVPSRVEISNDTTNYESAALLDDKKSISNSGLCPKINVQRPSNDQSAEFQTPAIQGPRQSNNKPTAPLPPQDGFPKQRDADDNVTTYSSSYQDTERVTARAPDRQTLMETANVDHLNHSDNVLAKSSYELRGRNSGNYSSSPTADSVHGTSPEEHSKHRVLKTAPGPRADGEKHINYSCSYEISPPGRLSSVDVSAVGTQQCGRGGGRGIARETHHRDAAGKRLFYAAQISRGGELGRGHGAEPDKGCDPSPEPTAGSAQCLPWLRPFFLPSTAMLKSPASAGHPRHPHLNKEPYVKSHKSMGELCAGLAPNDRISPFKSGTFYVRLRKIAVNKIRRSYSLSVLEFREYPEIRKSATQQNGDLDTVCQFRINSEQAGDAQFRLNYVETDHDIMLGYDQAGTDDRAIRDDTVFRFDDDTISKQLGCDVPGINLKSSCREAPPEPRDRLSCKSQSPEPLRAGEQSPAAPRLRCGTPSSVSENAKPFCYQNGVQGPHEKPDELLVPPSPLPKSVLKPSGSISSRTSGESTKSPTFAVPLPKISSREMDSELDDDEEALSDMATTVFLDKLRRHRSQGSKTSKSSVKSTGSRRRFARERQMTLMLLSVTAAFLLSWVPPWVIYMVSFYGPSYAHSPVLEHVLFEHLTTVQLVNFVANPIIYYTFNPTFRLKVRGLVPARPKPCLCAHRS